MKKTILKMLFSIVLILGTATSFAQPKGGQNGQKPPTPEETMTKMDTNKDGKLSKEEVKGPLKDDFTKIDTDKDGFLSSEELKKAPKPNRKEKE
jgi:hypothetical protein